MDLAHWNDWLLRLAVGSTLIGALAAGAVYFTDRQLRSDADAKLEGAQRQIVSLRKEQRGRDLSDDQKAILDSRIRSVGWRKVEIIWHGTGEPERYARKLAAVFDQAGVAANVHTLDPFIPSAWGLLVVKTTNDDSTQLKAMLDEARVASEIALTNSTLGEKDHPTLVIGTREDEGVPQNSAAPTQAR